MKRTKPPDPPDDRLISGLREGAPKRTDNDCAAPANER
jgi:hypothetical protein